MKKKRNSRKAADLVREGGRDTLYGWAFEEDGPLTRAGFLVLTRAKSVTARMARACYWAFREERKRAAEARAEVDANMASMQSLDQMRDLDVAAGRDLFAAAVDARYLVKDLSHLIAGDPERADLQEPPAVVVGRALQRLEDALDRHRDKFGGRVELRLTHDEGYWRPVERGQKAQARDLTEEGPRGESLGDALDRHRRSA